jgi:hypothetical protein
MRVNISKSKFFAEQIEYLGYWISRQGIQPTRNKVEAILNIIALTPNQLQVEIIERVHKVINNLLRSFD